MKIGSLFSGYGGLDMGVQSVLGGEVAWHIEYDKAPSRILAHHWPDIPNYGDVTAVDFTSIEPVDVLTGGYPCQPFSIAGSRKGTNDERHLWPHVLRAIRDMAPRIVVLENVRGHLTLGFETVLTDLANLGWSAEWGIVRASDTGAPHQRARLFILAYPADATGNGRPSRWAGSGEWPGSTGQPSSDHGPTANATGGTGRQQEQHHICPPERATEPGERPSWGDYAPAITQWEHAIRRPAPAPTEPKRTGKPQLNPAFVEWMMGLPAGWVTDPAIGISRNDQLKVLGNGVVPRQAALAVSLLTEQVAAA